MTDWTNDELRKIGNAEELKISSLREDGTLRKSRIIWVVRTGDDLYVRSVRGRTSDWFKGVLTCHQGRIQAGGIERDVRFVEESSPELNVQIDGVYRTKYRQYAASIIDSINSQGARDATLKLVAI
jgi:hypothetical protein